jgi:hypothetical protein
LAFKQKRPRTTILIFDTGNMVCTGARKEEDAYQAVVNLRRKLEENDLNTLRANAKSNTVGIPMCFENRF